MFVCVCMCTHVVFRESGMCLSLSQPAHLCIHPYLWMKVIQHCLGEARVACGFYGFIWSLCPVVGGCECACVCMHLDLPLCASVSSSWSPALFCEKSSKVTVVE